MKRIAPLLFFAFLYSLAAKAQTGTWSVTYLPQASYNLSEATSLSKAFFLVGQSKYLYIYDEPAGAWSTDSMYEKKSDGSIGALGSKIFVCGNDSNNAITDKVEIFDQLNNSWSTHHLSQARGGIRICSYANKAYFIGGYVPGMGPMHSTVYYGQTTIDVYDSTSNSWSVIQLPHQRFWHHVYAQNNKLFVCGGRDVQYNFNSSLPVDIFDLGTQAWISKTPGAATPSSSLCGIDTSLFLSYGIDNTSTASTTYERYDFPSDQWSAGAFHYAKDFPAATSGSDRVFFGGSSKYLDVYYAPGNYFYTDSLLLNRSLICFATVNKKVLFAGGALPGSGPLVATSHVDIFEDPAATISIKKNEKTSGFRVFPNPASSQLTVKMGATVVEAQVQLIDLNGKAVDTFRIHNTADFSVNCSSLTIGVYTLRVKTATDCFRQKIVITH